MILEIITPNIDSPISLDVLTCVWDGKSPIISVGCINNYRTNIKLENVSLASKAFAALSSNGVAKISGEIIPLTNM